MIGLVITIFPASLRAVRAANFTSGDGRFFEDQRLQFIAGDQSAGVLGDQCVEVFHHASPRVGESAPDYESPGRVGG